MTEFSGLAGSEDDAAMVPFVQALLAFQKDAPALRRDSKGQFDNSYLSLETLVDQVRPALNAVGLVLVQACITRENEPPMLTTAIVHAESGAGMTAELALPVGGNLTAQALGSAITYARRYQLMCMLGLVADDDDDGKVASAPAAAPPAAQAAGPKLITKDQRTRLHAKATENQVATERVKEIIKDVAGVDSSTKILQGDYDAVVAAVEAESIPF
jgi:hypothetical protein